MSILEDVLKSNPEDEDDHSSDVSDNSTVLIVRNKADLIPASKNLSDTRNEAHGDAHTPASLSISCATGEGISELETALTQAVENLLGQGGGQTVGDSPIITRQRHRRHVQLCVEHLRRFLYLKLPMDLAAEELRYQ